MNASSNENVEGFAALMHNQFVRPLKDSKEFKEQYKDTNLSILFNITDASHSAILSIDNGTIDVRGILRENEDEIEKAKDVCDASIETDMRTFMKMNSMSTLKTIWNMITGKLKIKGGKHLKILEDLRVLAEEEDAQDFF